MKQAGGTNKFILRSEQKDIPHGNTTMEHIGIICRHWCRKNKIEISWIVFEGLTGEDCNVFEKIYRKYLLLRENPKTGISIYNDYRDFIIKFLKEILDKGFKEFNQLLVQGDNKTWKMFDKTMRKYAWIWAKNRGISINEDINTCYFSALSTLYEKLYSKKMTFANSCELKSYYFRIFENKTMENHRMNRKYLMTTSNIPELIYEEPDNENDDILAQIKRYIRKLEYIEQYILLAYFLYEKKLTEIATELKITPENCRVIKHRTINRLIQLLPKEMVKKQKVR